MTPSEFIKLGQRLEAVYDCCRDELEESKCKECPYGKHHGDRCWRVMISDVIAWKREAETQLVLAKRAREHAVKALAKEVLRNEEEDI